MSDDAISASARWGEKAIRLVDCPRCGAGKGQKCRTFGGKKAGTEYEHYVHATRTRPFSEEYFRGLGKP